MDLLECRNRLDEIDAQIVGLFERRMHIAEEVAQVKIASGGRVLDRKREKEKLEKLSSMTLTPFNRQAITEIYEQIMAISRRRQYQLLGEAGELRSGSFLPVDTLYEEKSRIACQGGPGGDAHKAAAEFFERNVDVIYCDTWRDAMSCMEEAAADFAVLPLETSSSGIISQSYDLLLAYEYYIAGEVTMSVCRGEDGKTDSKRTGEEPGEDFVRYALVTNRKIFSRDACQISVVTEISDESGALYRALSHFIYNNLNLKKIESRPVQGSSSTYRFFIDLEGNLQEPAVRGALLGLRDETGSLKVLGNYRPKRAGNISAQLRLSLQ